MTLIESIRENNEILEEEFANASIQERVTALFDAIGRPDAVKAILNLSKEDKSTLVCKRRKDGLPIEKDVDGMETPLHRAVFKEDVDSIEMFLEAGASKTHINGRNQTPRELALDIFAAPSPKLLSLLTPESKVRSLAPEPPRRGRSGTAGELSRLKRQLAQAQAALAAAEAQWAEHESVCPMLSKD